MVIAMNNCKVAEGREEEFIAGHRQGSLMGVLEGPPQVTLYEALIVETPEGRAVPTS